MTRMLKRSERGLVPRLNCSDSADGALGRYSAAAFASAAGTETGFARNEHRHFIVVSRDPG